MFQSLGITPREAISTKSPAFRAMKLVLEKLSDEKIIALMVKEPRLIRRPLIVMDQQPYTFQSAGKIVPFVHGE